MNRSGSIGRKSRLDGNLIYVYGSNLFAPLILTAADWHRKLLINVNFAAVK